MNPRKNAPLPVICITTTAGTGSEADQWGVITNDETNEKIGFGGDDRLFPVISDKYHGESWYELAQSQSTSITNVNNGRMNYINKICGKAGC